MPSFVTDLLVQIVIMLLNLKPTLTILFDDMTRIIEIVWVFCLTCFHGLFLYTMWITQSMSLDNLHLMTSICWLEYPAENNNAYLQERTSFTNCTFKFLQNYMIITADLNITIMTNLFHDNSIVYPSFIHVLGSILSRNHVFLDITW